MSRVLFLFVLLGVGCDDEGSLDAEFDDEAVYRVSSSQSGSLRPAPGKADSGPASVDKNPKGAKNPEDCDEDDKVYCRLIGFGQGFECVPINIARDVCRMDICSSWRDEIECEVTDDEGDFTVCIHEDAGCP